MPDYKNSKIYKLVSPHTDKIYIGSTTQILSQRLSQHKRTKTTKSHFLFELGDVKIILIEDCPCNRKEELLKKERYYIENFDCLNKCIPGRKYKEYYQDNKKIIREKTKDYLIEYNKNNEDKLKIYRKKYYEKNKKLIAEKQKKYNEQRKQNYKNYI